MGEVGLDPGDCLREGLVRLGICVSGDECINSGIYDKLSRYVREVERWNKRFNLVRGKGNELVIRHLLDSLSVYELLNNECKNLSGVKFNVSSGSITPVGHESYSLMDIGSGAGFPGIPLSIVFPKLSITLVERMEKRVAFLRNVVFGFGLKNVRIICEDLKNLKDDISSYDIITFRAFSRLEKILGMTVPLLKKKGFVMAYKGRLAMLKTEVATLTPFFKHIEVVKVNVPFLDAERHMLIVRKKDYLGGF